ncbi:uncharacterized protein LOC144346474 [Saccoglossus kowalevskii]
MTELLTSALAPSTRCSYKRAWQALQSFHLKHYTGILTLPVSESLIAMFLTDMHMNGFAANTITTTASAISYLHKLQGYKNLTDSFVVKKLLSAMRKQTPTIDRRLPISRSILHALVDSLPYIVNSGYNHRLFKALFLFMLYACTRIGEVTFTTNNVSHILQLHDIAILHPGCSADSSLKVTFTKYKHGYAPQVVIIGCQRVPYCPIAAISTFISVRGQKPGPLFCMPDQQPIKRDYFMLKFNAGLHFCGLSPQYYKGHSFCIGAASEAASSGLCDAQIRSLGRWKSDAFKLYTRQHAQF